MKFSNSVSKAFVVALLLNESTTEGLTVNHRLAADLSYEGKAPKSKSENEAEAKEELEKYTKMKMESMKEKSEEWEKETFNSPTENDGYASAMREGDRIMRKEMRKMQKIEMKSIVREVEPFKVEIEKEEPLEKKEAKKSAETIEEEDEEKEEIEKEESEEKKVSKMSDEEKKIYMDSCENGCATGM